MAKANVNISDVTNFSNAINVQNADIQATISRMQSMVASSMERVVAEIQKADQAIAECEKRIQQLEAERNKLQIELSSLQSALSSTPQTIQEPYEDEDGETQTREVPNPEYDRLLGEINAVSQKLEAVEKEIQELVTRKAELERQRDILKGAQRDLNECNSSLSAAQNEFTALSQEASTKLSNVIQVLNEYTSTTITPPTLGGRRTSNGYSVARGSGVGSGSRGNAGLGGAEQYSSVIDYLGAHDYGPEDYEKYSKDPVWRELMRREFPEVKMPYKNISEYLVDHDYGPGDYEKYSQDPVWRELMQREFPDVTLPDEETGVVTEKGAYVSKEVLEEKEKDVIFAENAYQDYVRSVIEGGAKDEKLEEQLLMAIEYAEDELFDVKRGQYYEQSKAGDFFATPDGIEKLSAISGFVVKTAWEKAQEALGGPELEDSQEELAKKIGELLIKRGGYRIAQSAVNGTQSAFENWCKQNETETQRLMRERPFIVDENDGEILSWTQLYDKYRKKRG